MCNDDRRRVPLEGRDHESRCARHGVILSYALVEPLRDLLEVNVNGNLKKPLGDRNDQGRPCRHRARIPRCFSASASKTKKPTKDRRANYKPPQ